MKIDEREIRELMKLALQGRIDINDLTGTEKANILYFARQDKSNELEFLHRLLIANPTQKWENLISYSRKLNDCDILINLLTPDKNKSVKLDGAKQLQDKVREYLNDGQAITKDGLELRSRQIREAITYFKLILADPDDYNHIKTEDLDRLKQFITTFELLAENISIRLEKYSNQSDQPQKKTLEPITYQWTKQPGTQLPILYQRLISGGFIDPETTPETFTACFTGQPVESITEKIHWLESKVLLSYFVDSLIRFDKIPKTKFWSIAEKVFADAANLKQAKGNFKSYGEPGGYEKIDDILKQL